MAERAPIAYLAPEIPALSATFVYEELLGLERRGIPVLPITVRRPAQPAPDQAALAARTRVLYGGGALGLALGSVLRLPRFGRRAGRALGWLAADLAAAGLHRPAAWKLAFQFLAAVRLAGLLEEAGCRHLHVHFAHVPAQIAMYAAALSGLPFTVTAHANDIFQRGLLLPEKARRAARMLTISEHNRAYLEGLGVPAHRLAVVRCGVAFPIAEAPRPPAAGPVRRLGSLGRLVEKKGMDVLLEAAARLRLQGRQIEVDIAGDGPLRAELEALAGRLGLSGTVRFLGPLGHREVAAWLQGLDAFVLACKADAQGDMDGIPVVLMEAMSQGVPVVSTRLSGIPELVIDRRTGLLAEPGDGASLAEQLMRLLDSAPLARELARQAAAHVREEFGQAANLDRLLGHFGLAPCLAGPGQPSTRELIMNRRYVLISPCRNEAQYMRQTLDTVIAQSIRPARWVIVDDGSTDATPRILAEYAARHDWIRIVTRSDRGRRAVGPGVIEAFYAGYQTIAPDDYEYLCKLDLDLRLPPRYFEGLMTRMEANPRIGTCSGKAYIEAGGRLVNERHGDETSVGASKFYRVACFQELGGFVREVMWDGIDCHRCRMKGWIACSWDDPELRFVHLRPMGSSQTGIFTGRMRHGFGQYFMGTGFVYMAASAVNRMLEKPYVLGGLAMLWGWMKSALQRRQRFEDQEFRRFLRRYQRRALLVGKKQAIEEIHREKGIVS